MVEIDNKPYFCGSDVAKALGYSNPRDAIIRHCKGVVKHDVVSETTNQYGITSTLKAIRDHVYDEDKLTERIVLSDQNREVICVNNIIQRR